MYDYTRNQVKIVYNGLMRLDRLLANSGYGTRSEVKDLIRKGLVTCDGRIIKDPGAHVDITAVIHIGQDKATIRERIYLLLDKPDCMLTASEDKRLPSVGDLIPPDLKSKKISPVGRLDYHTTGLLILTNDGELSHRLTSPKYAVEKVYRVAYEGSAFTGEEVSLLSKGITLVEQSGPVKLAPCRMDLYDNNICELTLTEGKTHEVRRIISHFGRTVTELRRIKLGCVILDTCEPGSLRELTEDEVSGLRSLCGLSDT